MKGLSILSVLLGLILIGPAYGHDTVYYYSGDMVHSEVVITDASRNVVEQTHYAPYGQVLNRTLRDGPGYTGHEEDPETSLSYMQQRYYDPESGRFVSTDPVATTDDGGSFNRYAYVGNDPLDKTDPTGDDAACVYAGDCQTFLNVNNVPGNIKTTGEIAGAVGLAAATEGIGELAEGGSILAKVGQALNGIRKLFGAAEDIKAADGLARNVAQGKAGEAITRAKLGDRIAGEQVTFKTSTGQTARPDFVTTDREVVETKTGNSGLSSGQAQLKSDIDAGRPVTPVGGNAEKAGLTPGEPIKMKCFQVDRPC